MHHPLVSPPRPQLSSASFQNLGIKVTDVLRSGYRQLGSILASQGYLPDKDLIFYLSHTEIAELIDHRPAKLVAKAVRRKKLMNTLKTFHYPEIITGQPKPVRGPPFPRRTPTVPLPFRWS